MFIASLDGSEPHPTLEVAELNNQIQIKVSTGDGLPYALEGSSNLIDWSGLVTNVPPFTVLDSASAEARFYRARRAP